ncbi:thermonuclease family protein, partial [Patescibacteria group bacterium]|nr:thermonuclease family protein [Patescibacteria group bacterium]
DKFLELQTLLEKEEISNNSLNNEGIYNYEDIIQNQNALNNNDILREQNNNNLNNNDDLKESREYNIKDIISADTFLLENNIQITLASIAVPKLGDKMWHEDECKAKEALNYVSKNLSDNKVKLKYGNSLNFDSASRLLAYVYFKDKTSGKYKLLNKELLYLGLANILDCSNNLYCDLNIYKELEKSYQHAKENNLGIFSANCVENNDNDNKISNLARNLFKGISLKSNQIINSLGQVVNKPKKDNQNEDNSDDGDANLRSDNNGDNVSGEDINSSDDDVSNDENLNNEDNNEEIEGNLEDKNNEDEFEYNTCIDELLISAVYSTNQDDYIEIYNNCDEDIDLVANNIRLEKAVSVDNPSIMIRFNEESDYSASSAIIKAYDSYTISRAEANLSFNTDAISLRENFSLGDSGYSIYLARGPVSNSSDEDIIDLLGYGSSSNYLGIGPAPSIEDYMLLRRKVDTSSGVSSLDVFHDYSLSGIYNSDDNYFNFIAIPSGFSEDSSSEDDGEFDDESEDEEEKDYNIISLWHLDSCFGEYVYDELSGVNSDNTWQWSAREAGCVLKANYNDEALELPISNDIDPNNMSILWDLQFENDNSRINLELVTVEGDNLILTLSPYYIEITKPGHTKVKYEEYNFFIDNNWHRLSFTVDSSDISDSSLNIYLDNDILSTINLGQRLYDLSSIKFRAENSYIQIDEIAIFDKALNEEDLSSLSSKINPYLAPEFVGTLDLKHSWDFLEGQGTSAYDTINNYNLNISESYWSNGISDYGIEMNKSNSEISSELLIDNNRKSFSLSFWYRNSAYTNEGRGRIMLKNGVNTKLGFKFTPYKPYLYFNNKEIKLSNYDIYIPDDDNWHFIALSFDASNYNLKFYLDGIEVYSKYKSWLDTSFNYMEILYENYSFQLDEIKIYEGVLGSELINNSYQQKYY